VILRAARERIWRTLNAPILGIAPRRPRALRDRQSGFAYIMALIAVMVMLVATLAIFEQGATLARRDREEEMIWRGNQYKRAIRLYYHKTGKYPQTIDDLTKGLPQLHFLRQEYKDPTNKADGAWRFIYVNAAGSIIGSTKYATLQQMQLLDMNGGVMPTIPGQPGVPASSLASGSQPSGINSTSGNGSDSSGQSSGFGSGSGSGPGSDSGSNSGSTGSSGGQNGLPPGVPPGVAAMLPNGANSTPEQIAAALSANGIDPSQAAQFLQNAQNSQNSSQSGSGNNSSGFGSNSSGFGQSPNGPGSSSIFGPGGSSPTGSNLSSSNMPGAGINGMPSMANLAALAQLKPTGPVDGPVLGGFLTGVGGKVDAKSVKNYHGAKKLNQFEFIWNPLEDAAAALQNQMNNMQSSGIGTGMAGTNSTSPNGASGSSGFGSTFGNSGSNPSSNPQPTQQPTSPPNQ
jgi:hypothetical protein